MLVDSLRICLSQKTVATGHEITVLNNGTGFSVGLFYLRVAVLLVSVALIMPISHINVMSIEIYLLIFSSLKWTSFKFLRFITNWCFNGWNIKGLNGCAVICLRRKTKAEQPESGWISMLKCQEAKSGIFVKFYLPGWQKNAIECRPRTRTLSCSGMMTRCNKAGYRFLLHIDRISPVLMRIAPGKWPTRFHFDEPGNFASSPPSESCDNNVNVP